MNRHFGFSLGLWLLLMMLTSPAYAIRILGNGGGYAEMMAHTAVARLRAWVIPCALRPKSCGLSEAESQWLQRLLDHDALNTRLARVNFAAEADGTSAPYELHFNPKQLYIDEQTPQPFVRIGQQMFEAWLLRPWGLEILRAAQVSADQVRVLADKIFQRIEISEFSLLPGERPAVIRIAHIIEGAEVRESILSYEGQSQTVDLTRILHDGLLCSGAMMPQNVHILDVDFSEPRLNGQVRWVCGREQYQARFSILLPENVVENLAVVKAQIMARRQRTVENRCEAEMKK